MRRTKITRWGLMLAEISLRGNMIVAVRMCITCPPIIACQGNANEFRDPKR